MGTCQATTKNGQPCGANALAGSPFCFWHSPDRERDVLKAQTKGGYRRKTPAGVTEFPGEISDMKGVLVWINTLLRCSWEAENSDKRTRALTSLLRLAVESLQVSDIEARLELLEAMYERQKSTG